MKTFDYDYTVTMGDVNAMGNFYFLKYFELQGHVRELWLMHNVQDCVDLLKENILSTKSAHCDFKIPFFLYDVVTIKMYACDLRLVSVKLCFDYYMKSDSRLCASGFQTVVCKNKERKTCRMPLNLANAFEVFLNG